MGLCDEVRNACAEIAADARSVSIDVGRLGEIEPGPPQALDPEHHFLEGSREDVTAYLLTLDTINFGSGWFPTLNKKPGLSGYFTIASSLSAQFRSAGPWTPEELRSTDVERIALVLDQDPTHELMDLYAQALRDLGRFLDDRTPADAVDAAGGSAERFAVVLAHAMPFFDDTGFYKRAQIVPNDLALAGVAEFDDLDRLTIFADNLVPHVLHVDGVLRYDDELARRIDAEELLPPGREEREIRACAVHACELIARELDVPPRVLDTWLWTRAQAPEYKARPRHRTRSVYY